MHDDKGALPPASVLAAWAVSDPVRLSGGQGLSYVAGGLVLKPAGDSDRAVWLAEVLDGVRADGLRVIRPVRSRWGTWVVDGWAAWQWLDGEHRSDAWDDVLEVSARFHRAVADVPWSPALVASHRWAVADRVAWGEVGGDLPGSVTPLLDRRRPVDLPCQLVHGDLGGNVLFSDGQPPAVIDVSPYWRPAGYADAIVVADAVAWSGAGPELAERLLRDQGEQLLLRAVLFRVATDPRFAPAYATLVPLVTDWAAAVRGAAPGKAVGHVHGRTRVLRQEVARDVRRGRRWLGGCRRHGGRLGARVLRWGR